MKRRKTIRAGRLVWDITYTGINRCNKILTEIKKLEGVMDEDRYERIVANARFYRACFYARIMIHFGDPVMVPEDMDMDSEQGRESAYLLARTDMWTVLPDILKEFHDVAPLLPVSYTGGEIERATRGAAMALKARVLLFEASKLVNPSNDSAKWQAAAKAAGDLIEKEAQTGYDLFGDYRKLFLPANEHSCECVFNVEFSKTKNTAVNSFNVYSVQYRNNAPLLDLVMDYRTTTDGAATMGKYDNLDPRFAATNFYPGSTFLGKANCPASEVCQFTGFAHKKLTIYDEQKRDSDDGNGETNYMFIRYADVLLMFAEAQNEVDATPSKEVYDAVNRVRERVGMPTYTFGTKSQAEMREIIRHERRIEFAGEGLYYNDIRRWMTAERVMNAVIQDYAGTDIAVRAFDPDRDYWWPVPADQILLNKKLEQNPNY